MGLKIFYGIFYLIGFLVVLFSIHRAELDDPYITAFVGFLVGVICGNVVGKEYNEQKDLW